MNILQFIIKYYKVGRFLHLVALMSFGITTFAIIKLLSINNAIDDNNYLLWLAAMIVFGSMGVLAELDGFSRFQNYKQLKDQLFLNSYQERLLKPMLRSSCQRDAALISCEELGLGKEVRMFFKSKGYEWYHIIPDFVFQYPLFFFSAFFWRTTFFTPYYKPKVDYSQLNIAELNLSKKGLLDGTATS
jgi:hypothetical protein